MTMNREVTEWFAHQHGENGTIYEAQLRKKKIL